MMKRQILAAMVLALTMPLVACGPTAPPASAGTAAPVATPGNGPSLADRVAETERRYRSARTFFDLLIAPLMSAEDRAVVDAIGARVEQALGVARSTAPLADRLRALRHAEEAAAELERQKR